MSHPSRRDFVRGSLAATVGLAAASQAAERPKPKPKIRIGVRFNEAWLHSNSDDDLRFFKQIGNIFDPTGGGEFRRPYDVEIEQIESVVFRKQRGRVDGFACE